MLPAFCGEEFWNLGHEGGECVLLSSSLQPRRCQLLNAEELSADMIETPDGEALRRYGVLGRRYWCDRRRMGREVGGGGVEAFKPGHKLSMVA